MQDRSIEKIYWSEVELNAQQFDFFPTHSVYAIWPSPVDHDECFKKAGFMSFADTDEKWEAEFKEIIQELVCVLETCGKLIVRSDIKAITNSGFKERILIWLGRMKPIGLLEKLFIVARDDQFGDCVVDFGSKEIATLRIGSGHPILWLSLDSNKKNLLPKCLSAISKERPVEKMVLNWKHLVS